MLDRIDIEDRRIRATMTQLLALGRNPADAMEDLAVIGENTTRERFHTQTGPDGMRWKPSLRARLSGTRTLTRDGHLGDSITHRSDARMAEWGTNMEYGPIHQLGGVIRPVSAKSLRFRLANGAFVSTKEVNMPARPFLGISSSDEVDMLDALEARTLRTIDGAR